MYFSLPEKRSPQIRKRGYTYFYIRNSHYVKVEKLELLCVDYGLKLARFYDRNFEKLVQEEIHLFLNNKLEKKCENCRLPLKRLRRCKINEECNFNPHSKKKLSKLCNKKFKKKYGISLISKALRELFG